jgi:hypothetical protein
MPSLEETTRNHVSAALACIQSESAPDTRPDNFRQNRTKSNTV